MRKLLLLFTAILIVFSSTAYAPSKKKTIEVLYFKAKMCSCKARVCNALEADVKSVLEKEFPDKNIEFKTIWIADVANKALVEKFNAKSQTVVMVIKKREKETISDLTEIVYNYSLKKNIGNFEKELKAKITENLK